MLDYIRMNGGSAGIPRYVLVDADGIVVGHDIPGEEKLEELLKQVFDPALERGLHEELGRGVAAYQGGAIGAAHALATALLEHEDETVAADARFLCDKATAYAVWQRRQLEREFAGGDAEARYGRALIVRRMFDGLELADWVDGRIEEFADEPKIEKNKKLWRELERLLDREFGAYERNEYGRVRGLERAVKDYGKFVDKHRRKTPSRIAKERAGALAGGR